jgi:hypothetical protein
MVQAESSVIEPDRRSYKPYPVEISPHFIGDAKCYLCGSEEPRRNKIRLAASELAVLLEKKWNN